ncbi:hypothetical protein FQA47_006227 [Oryzias melastigma]|uniref:Uncharacterized protein n=1 Tax=Oryzias melastigma TaxID=30732 RepID=A0A834FLF3_ORYME|nr:hypothetical protein FQA47_006227 [Oryzias melastigma]
MAGPAGCGWVWEWGGGVPAVGNGVYCLTAAALDLTSLTPFLPVCAYQPPLSQISRCQAEPSGITGGAARLHLRQQAQVRVKADHGAGNAARCMGSMAAGACSIGPALAQPPVITGRK